MFLEAGYGGQICALVGLTLHPLVLTLPQPIILAFDADAAGQHAQNTAQTMLTERGIAWLTLPPQPWDDHKDFAAFWSAQRYIPFDVVDT